MGLLGSNRAPRSGDRRAHFDRLWTLLLDGEDARLVHLRGQLDNALMVDVHERTSSDELELVPVYDEAQQARFRLPHAPSRPVCIADLVPLGDMQSLVKGFVVNGLVGPVRMPRQLQQTATFLYRTTDGDLVAQRDSAAVARLVAALRSTSGARTTPPLPQDFIRLMTDQQWEVELQDGTSVLVVAQHPDGSVLTQDVSDAIDLRHIWQTLSGVEVPLAPEDDWRAS